VPEVWLSPRTRKPSDAVQAAVTALLVLGTDGADPVAELEGNVDQDQGAATRLSQAKHSKCGSGLARESGVTVDTYSD